MTYDLKVGEPMGQHKVFPKKLAPHNSQKAIEGKRMWTSWT